MHYNLICIFICTPICTKFYSCKKWVLQSPILGVTWDPCTAGDILGAVDVILEHMKEVYDSGHDPWD
jgi:hypothetical protein